MDEVVISTRLCKAHNFCRLELYKAIMWSSFSEHCSGHDKHGLVTAILVLSLTAFAAAFWKRSRAGLPPGPRGLPLIGYLPFLGKELHHEFEKLAGAYGAIYSLWLGNKLCVVVSSPELVKEVVRDQDTVFANRDLTISTFIGSYGANDIAFGSYGPQWKKLRKVFVKEMLNNRVLDNFYGLRRDEVHKSVRQIYQRINTPIKIDSLSFTTTINIMMSMLLGSSSLLEGEKAAVVDVAKIKETVAELMVLFGLPNISDIFPSLASFDLQGIEKETKKVIGVIEGIFDSTIEHRKKIMHAKSEEYDIGENVNHKQQRKDFLELLLELHENGDDATSISEAQVKALLSDTLVGGTDTTTTMVEWTMAELLKHPEAMRKVQQELTQVVGLSNMVEESHLSQLTYLDAAIKESFRLHPPLPLLVPRRPSITTTIGGYKVPKDTKVFINVWAIQRDPKIWEDPLEFRLERFLCDNNYKGNKFDYSGNNFNFLPFGSGRRICAGIPLAERTLSYVLASFLHSFEWKLPRDEAELEMSNKFGIVVKKLEPLSAIPTPRLSNLELYT